MHYTLLAIILLSSGMLSGMERGLTSKQYPKRLAMTDNSKQKNRSCKQVVACCVPALSTVYFAFESLQELQETGACGLNYGLCCFCAMVTCERCLKNVASIREKAQQKKAYLTFIQRLPTQTKQKEK